MQEGDPKYLAPEVLNNNNNITYAADIFSLGMTILELATDLDLPRGGDAWHQLRNNQIPTHLISSLSGELVEIIMKMIERDHLRRATVDQLLSMPKIKSLVGAKNRRLIYSNLAKNVKSIYSRVYGFTLTMWYFLIIYPWFKLRSYVNSLVGGSLAGDVNSVEYNVNSFSNGKSSDESCQTSTPKKNLLSEEASLLLMNVADEDEHNYGMFSNWVIIFLFL